MSKSITELFTQLLQSIDPEKKLISEDKKAELVNLFEEKLNEVKQRAFEKALETVDEDHANKLQTVIEQIEKQDEDHANKLQTLVETIDDDHTSKLQTLVEAIDEDHANKLQHLLETIDEEHASQLQQVIDKIDEDHANKLQQIIEMFETKGDSKLVDQISNYLDMYLEEVKPQALTVNEARIAMLENTINKIREMLLVTDEKVQSEIKEAVLDAHNIITEKDNQINKLMLEKAELKQQVVESKQVFNEQKLQFEAEQLLENKIAGCSPKMAAYLKLCFKDATKQTIEENFDEAVAAYKQTEAEQRQRIVEQVRNANKGLIPESVQVEGLVNDNTRDKNIMSVYANITKETTKRLR